MKLFVAQLDYNVNDDELQSVFEEFGTIDSCKVITDRETGRSRGFGFVEMDNESEARNAISEMDGRELRGRRIVVKEAEDRKR